PSRVRVALLASVVSTLCACMSPPRGWVSIRLGEPHPPLRRLARDDALALLLRPVEGDAADGRLGLRADAVLGRPGAVPVRPQEAAGLLDLLLELVVGVDLETAGVAEPPGPLEQVGLHLAQQR